MENDDMCIYKKDGQIKALGWNINSELLQKELILLNIPLLGKAHSGCQIYPKT